MANGGATRKRNGTMNASLLCVLLSNAAAGLAWRTTLPLPLPVDALLAPAVAPSTSTSFVRRRRPPPRRRTILDLDPRSVEPDATDADSGEDRPDDAGLGLTTALLKVAYDGTHYRGWTAGNSDAATDGSRRRPPEERPPKSRRGRTRRRKGRGGRGGGGKVRTVSNTIRAALAKLYGDVPPDRIAIESCSRTDAGVHATSLVCQFYCRVGEDDGDEGNATRPASRDDANFRPLPFDADLTKLVFVLNRMLPPDVRIAAASPPPLRGTTSNGANGDVVAAFHPTRHAVGKTYAYRFAAGPIHDPLRIRSVWHLDGSPGRGVGMNGAMFRPERCVAAARLFADHPAPRSYAAFRAAFRGTDRGREQDATCRLWRCEVLREGMEELPSWEAEARREMGESGLRHTGLRRTGSRLDVAAPETYVVVVEGDRFLYKMVRNIVGTIVAVGCGHLELEDVRVALDAGAWGGGGGEDRRVGSEGEGGEGGRSSDATMDATAGSSGGRSRPIRRICAPARGLTLVDVHYPEDIRFDWRAG